MGYLLHIASELFSVWAVKSRVVCRDKLGFHTVFHYAYLSSLTFVF